MCVGRYDVEVAPRVTVAVCIDNLCSVGIEVKFDLLAGFVELDLEKFFALGGSFGCPSLEEISGFRGVFVNTFPVKGFSVRELIHFPESV